MPFLQAPDRRGGGSGGTGRCTRGEASANDSAPRSGQNGLQLRTGGGGTTAPALAQSVVRPRQRSDSTPITQRAPAGGGGGEAWWWRPQQDRAAGPEA